MNLRLAWYCLACLLVAALPLAGCGNKGPLILPPQPASEMPGAAAPAADDTGVLPPDSATVMPPSASTLVPDTSVDEAPVEDTDDDTDDDGTPGTPR